MDTYRLQMLDDQPETDDDSLQDEQSGFEPDTSTEPIKQSDKQPKRTFFKGLSNYNDSMSSMSKEKRRLVRIGVIVAGVIIVSLLLAMTYKYWAIQRNVTAFQVGAAQKAPQNVGGGGIVYPLQQLNVAYPAPERAMDVLVKAGDQVKVGQPLIKLDPALLNAQINQASASLSAAQAYLNSVSGAFPYNGVAVAAAQQALAIAQSRYNTLSSQNASQTMRNGNLISPVKGIIAAVNINSGETFAANAILISLMDQSSVVVRAKIPLANINQIHAGMPATVTPSALPNETLNGTVTSIVPQADPQTDTFGVWVQVANPQQDILPGMSAFVQLKTQVDAYVIPRLAVLNPDRESSIFEIRNNHAYMAPVHVIGRSENTVYIDQGLRPGEIIVLLPLNKILKEGQQINVIGTEH